jgi:hypothetical protein
MVDEFYQSQAADRWTRVLASERSVSGADPSALFAATT